MKENITNVPNVIYAIYIFLSLAFFRQKKKYLKTLKATVARNTVKGNEPINKINNFLHILTQVKYLTLLEEYTVETIIKL